MTEFRPDLLNELPPSYPEATHNLFQRAVDTTELLGYLSENEDLTEEEALAFAESACGTLDDIGNYDDALLEEWHSEATAIEPENNLAGFLEWDGLTEPEQMRSIRLSRNSLGTSWRPLNTAIIQSLLNTYAKHHLAGPDDEVTATQAGELQTQVVNALVSGRELPFEAVSDERYTALITTVFQKRGKHFDGKFDLLGTLTLQLQERRREFDPDYSTTRKLETHEDARASRLHLEELWSEVLRPQLDLDTDWSQLRDTLLDSYKQPRAELSDPSTINDAIRLLARILPSLRSTSPDDYDRRGYGLHGFLENEKNSLINARKIVSRAEDLEDADLALTPIQNLTPRLYRSVLYLYAQAELVDEFTQRWGPGRSIFSVELRTFLKRAIYGPGMRAMGEIDAQLTDSETSEPLVASSVL